VADERIAEEFRGVRFRQIAPKLRWPVGEGFGTQTESVRPRNKNTLRFEDPEGTFIVFEDEARINIPRLLRTGALVIEDTNQRRGAKAEAAAVSANAPLGMPLGERPVSGSDAAEGGGPTA
jgi:hypothetical protein